MSSLCHTSVADAAAAVARRELSPVELTDAALARIDEVDGRVRAFETVVAGRAREAARRAEAEIASGDYRGALHGIPVAVKDLYDTAGIPTTASSRVLEGRIPQRDAACVERLFKAGAVLLGKTRMHEFAYGVTTPQARNPWSLERLPGGSSGGSAAAVAADECLLALGSDTAGSIRIPSAACGVVGLKPTYGRISTFGMLPLSWSLDHAGPIAGSVRDVAFGLGVLAGHDPRDLASSSRPVDDYVADLERGVAGLALGIPRNYYFDNLAPEVDEAVGRAIELLESEGAELREIHLGLAEYAVAAAFAICLPEATAYHEDMLRERPELYGEDVRLYLELGALRPATEYVRALRARETIRRAWRGAFEGIDAVVVPTLPATAARVGQETFALPGGDEPVVPAYLRLCAPANVVGLPSLSVPCGFDGDGLPIGLQIIGRPFAERVVLRVGAAYERATEWHARFPAL